MSEILFHYERVNPTTWAYLSSLLTLALFFKFNRLLSVRNLDLLLLILLAPAMICIKWGLDHPMLGGAVVGDPDGVSPERVEELGYLWLFGINTLLLVRMLADTMMVRRPLLEPNLTAGGLSFLTVSLLLFLAANVITGTPEQADLYAVRRAEHLAKREASELELSSLETHGPGFPVVFQFPHIVTQRLLSPNARKDAAPEGTGGGASPETTAADEPSSLSADNPQSPQFSRAEEVTAKATAIVCQAMIVLGILLVASWHFDNPTAGIAAATLYLMLPYTAMWTGSTTHALPGALLVWAILFYRRPFVAGLLIGLACGTLYYPLFLLPLWITFYWRRGAGRFVGGTLCVLPILILVLVFTSTDSAMFFAQLRQTFGVRLPRIEQVDGIWQFWSPEYRLPILAFHIGLSLSFILWPAQKNLATLLSASAALMLGAQFWHAHSGGLALGWYLPALLLTVFRPNLEDRVALDVVLPMKWKAPWRAAA